MAVVSVVCVMYDTRENYGTFNGRTARSRCDAAMSMKTVYLLYVYTFDSAHSRFQVLANTCERRVRARGLIFSQTQ